MKKLSIVLTALTFTLIVTAQSNDNATIYASNTEGINEAYTNQSNASVMEQTAHYVAGDEAMLAEIEAQLEYPSIAYDYGLEGKVYVKFNIDSNGSINNIRVAKDIGGGCGDAAVASVKKLSHSFSPAIANGQSIESDFIIPIRFKLN